MPSILLIEDDELFRGALVIALTERGYTVTQAGDGEEGVKLFRAAPTDLVLTDIVMPNKVGTATVGDLRHDYPKLGIIAMSGGARHEPALHVKMDGAFGATRTLKKPFDLPTLLATIKTVLAATGQDEPAA